MLGSEKHSIYLESGRKPRDWVIFEKGIKPLEPAFGTGQAPRLPPEKESIKSRDFTLQISHSH